LLSCSQKIEMEIERMGKMKKVTMFYMEGCPYCRAAQGWMDELFAQYPQFRKVELEKIEENENPELAEKYDYYYVPTFYVDGKKVHEGAASKRIVEQVFAMACGMNPAAV